MPFKIFISYSTKDLEKANQVKQRLGSFAAFGVQTYLAKYDAQPGAKLTEDLRKNLQAANVFCLLWSHNAKSSEWVSQEIGIATATKKLIIPIVLERDLQLPGFIQDLKYIAAYEGFDSAMASSEAIITTHAAQKASSDKGVFLLLVIGVLLLALSSKN